MQPFEETLEDERQQALAEELAKKRAEEEAKRAAEEQAKKAAAAAMNFEERNETMPDAPAQEEAPAGDKQ